MSTATQPLDLALAELLRRTGLALEEATTTTDALEQLWTEADEIAAPLQAEIDRLNARTLDPFLDRQDLDAAKKAANDLEHDSRRLAAIKDMLETRLRERRNKNRHAAHLAKHQATGKFCDEVEVMHRDEVPSLLRRLAEIAHLTMKANHMADEANRNLPPDCAPITRPEGRVRGFPDRDGYEQPAALTAFRLTQAILPDPDRPDGIIWPPVVSYEMNILDQRRGFRQTEINNLWRKKREG